VPSASTTLSPSDDAIFDFVDARTGKDLSSVSQ